MPRKQQIKVSYGSESKGIWSWLSYGKFAHRLSFIPLDGSWGYWIKKPVKGRRPSEKRTRGKK